MTWFIISYYAHPENVCFSVILSGFSTQNDRERALEKYLEFREIKRKSKAKKIRTFVPPTRKELNFDAHNPFDMVYWHKIKKSKKTPSPLFRDLSVDEVKSLVTENCAEAKKKIAKLLCHSQYCEGCVNMVSKTVSKVVSHEDQKAKIIVTKGQEISE